MCEAEGCDREAYARGLCGRHYKQQRRHGTVQPDPAPAACAVPDCERRAVTRGWCHGHYLRWQRTGDVRADVPLARAPRRSCNVEECGRPHHSSGLCRTHLARVRAAGHPATDVPVKAARPGGGSVSHGYRKVVVPAAHLHLTGGERNVLEHRLVMAVLLGRPLLPGEEVHHLNGDRLDNRPSNLELWSIRQPRGQRVEDKVAFALELLDAYEPIAGAAARQALQREPPDHSS